MDIIIERTGVNLESLDGDLRTALGEVVSGVSAHAGLVTVHLTGKSIPADSQTARQIVLNHNPAKLTPEQQHQQQQAAKLEALRQQKGGDLDAAKFDDPLLNELARKVAWLEQEILSRP